MKYEDMHRAVVSALSGHGEQVMKDAEHHLKAIEQLQAAQKICWESIESPKGSRSFNGRSEDGAYSVLVTQFQTAEHGIGHAGMAAVLRGTGMAVVLPAPAAERLYRAVAATSLSPKHLPCCPPTE